MTKVYSNTKSPILVAIDISKTHHRILIELPKHQRRKRVIIKNSQEDGRLEQPSFDEYFIKIQVRMEPESLKPSF